MLAELPSVVSPEVVSHDLISACIRATNRVWYCTYYQDLITTPDLQIVATPTAQEAYLNSAQLITTSDLGLVENSLLAAGISKPAIYVDPNTPTALLEKMAEAGYIIDPNETEVWRMLSLSTGVPHPNEVLKLSSDKLKLETWSTKNIPSHVLDAFLKIDQETNLLDNDTVSRLRNNLTLRTDTDAEILILLAKVDDQYASSLCVGIADGIANISEAGTLDSYRGLGLFPRLRLHAADEVRARGGSWLVSNTLGSNTSSHRGSDKSGFIRGFERHLYIKTSQS